MNDFTSTQWVIYPLISAIVLLLFFSCFVITQQKTSKILTLFGKFLKHTKPGLSLKAPWPFVVVKDFIFLNIQELKGEVTVKSSDNAFLTIPWALQFKVIATKVKEAYYELENPEAQMESYILNTLRGEASNLTMEQLFKSNESFEKAVNETLSEKFKKYGYEIINVLVDDPQPSKTLKTSFDEVIASKRKKEAAQNEAEATKIKMIGKAKAEGESLKIKGEAFKDFRKAIAEGNSESIELFLNDIKDDSLKAKDVLDFFAGVDLREAIRDASKGDSNVIVIPADFKNNITLPTEFKTK